MVLAFLEISLKNYKEKNLKIFKITLIQMPLRQKSNLQKKKNLTNFQKP